MQQSVRLKLPEKTSPKGCRTYGEVYSHLSEEERQVIQIEVGNGASIRGIGAMLGRSPSSISREIKRNTWFPSNENESYRPYRPKRLKAGPWTGRYYRRARAAQGRPQEIQATALPAVARPPVGEVAEWLGRGWSPLLISGRLRVLWPDDALMRVAPETIYRWVYSSRPLWNAGRGAAARAGGAAGTAAGGRRASRSRPSAHLERPPEADGRSAFGHWEADSVIGVGCNLHTEVGEEDQVPHGPASFRTRPPASVGAQLASLPLPAGARVSVTHDNGTEFAHHERLRDGGHGYVLRRPVPSWQRGSNENRNGRSAVRRPNAVRSGWTGKRSQADVDRSPTAPCVLATAAAEAFADQLLELQDQQGCCTSK